MLRNILRNYLCYRGNTAFLRGSSTTANINEKHLEEIALSEESEVLDEEDHLKEAEIEKKRNKSRLNPEHRNILHGNLPYSEPVAEFQKSVKYHRKLYGVYGSASGVNPGLCWPTKQEIQDLEEYEKIAFPYTIQEMMKKCEENRKIEEEKRQKRQEDIVKKVAKLEQWKKELQNRIEKKEAEARAAKERKDRLVEEVRRHFGFKIDPRDERFKEMLEQKEKAEKKAMKEAKRKMKEAKLIAKLQETKVDSVVGIKSKETEQSVVKSE